MRTIASFAIVTSIIGFASQASAQSVTFGGSANTNTGVQAKSNAAAPEPAAPSDEDKDKAWAERNKALNETATLNGSSGILRLQHAQSGEPGQFRLSFNTEWFSSGFLCTPEHPCRRAGINGAITGGANTNHIGATLALGVTVAKLGPGPLEAYLSTGGYANSNDANRPSLLQVLGDSTLGVKYGAPLSKIFHLGGSMELWLVNGTGAVGLKGGGTSARFTALSTFDLRGTQSKTPLRFGMNLSYVVDNTGKVIEDIERPTNQGGRGQSITRIERFGLKINRVDHVDLRLGAETFLVEDRIRPFLEYGIMIPSNRQGYECKKDNPSKDGCLAERKIAPSSLTLGSRFFPWKQGFSLLAAFDIGVSGTGAFIEEVSPTPPWMLFIGAGWAIDTQERPPVYKTKTVEKVVEMKGPQGHVKGFVHEKDKTEGIARAIVTYETNPELTAMATGADGRFTTKELGPGIYKFNVTAEGYKPGTCDGTIGKEAADVQVDCPLEALPRVGNVVGVVRDADSNAPIGGVQVKMVDANGKELSLSADGSGGFKFENVAPGTVNVHVTAEGYLALVQPLDVKVRQDNKVELMLKPKPKNSQVQIIAKEIIIKQQVQFQPDSSVILPESFPILTEVADLLIRNPQIKKIEIQGHTDNQGPPDHNKRLSESRAESVRAWLAAHGVQGDRMIAKGYGMERPLVPNVTAGNRARNRRVQFIIQEQGEKAPTTKPSDIKLPPGF